ncbi:MAG: hypothetical protein QOG13_3261 [Sphingomonadales bacterium]|jgi:hypothetical protein|nr:hypothetical protein [Sphingomonadales bacterium]
MTRPIAIIVATLAVAALVPEDACAESRVSRSRGFQNFEEEARRGALVVGAATSEPAAIKVYITESQSYLFVYSNYIVPGFSYPTQMLVDRADLLGLNRERLLVNLICVDHECAERLRDERPSQLASAEFIIDTWKISRSQISQLVDTSLLSLTWPNTRRYSATDGARDTARTQPPIADQTDIKSSSVSEAELPRNNSNRSDDTRRPGNLGDVVVALFWENVVGRWFLILLAIIAAFFALWKSLPDSEKSRIISRIVKRTDAD